VDEETSYIKDHIDTERKQLGRHLDELEYRVKNATDLKGYFDRNTGWILGAAVAGGFLLSLAIRKSSDHVAVSGPDRTVSEINRAATARPRLSHLNQVSETLDNIFAGLVGVASEKLHTFVADVVPGFREHYNAVEERRRSVQPMRPKFATDTDISAAKY
jgi:hypothetical protein